VGIHGFFFRTALDSKNTREHADDISIQNRVRLVESDATDGAGGVTANAWQIEHVFERCWELTTVPCHD